MPMFVKVFRMPRIVFFFKRKPNFSQVKLFFYIFKKSYLCLKLFTVLCFCCEAFTLGKGRVHLMSFEFIFFSININASNHIIFISVSFVQNINQIFQIPFNFFIAKLLLFQFRLVSKGFKIVFIKKLIHASSCFWISSIFKIISNHFNLCNF